MKRASLAFAISALLICCLLSKSHAAPASSASASLAKVQSDAASGITEYRLKSNGLQVLLAERHHTPVTMVMVVYHVGSRNEAVGYTGSTHFLEHMMFRGTQRHDPRKGTGIDDVLKPIGGINNATTYFDRTYYYEIVPSQYVGTCLDLEADRMRNALLRPSDQKAEMTVVRNELERDEDDPSRLMEVNTFAHAFMSHPYHHPVIGWRSDVENVPNARLRKFYNDFYYPNNATLIVIGDFKTPELLNLIAKNFAAVPASPHPFPPVYTTESAQQGERRYVVRRGEDLPKVQVAFHIPKATDKDAYALEVAASLLGDEKRQSSRLYKALIDTTLASDCYAYNYSLHDPALFALQATATPATPSQKLESVLVQQAQNLASQPISDQELEKAKKSVWKRNKLDAADPQGMASQLAEAIAVADWRWWADFEKNIKAVTAADVKSAAAKYFTLRNETVGYYYPVHMPAEKSAPAPEAPKTQSLLDVPAQAAAPLTQDAESKASQAVPPAQAAALPAAPSGSARVNHPTIASQVKKQVLKNGMTVLVMPVPGSGVVSVAGKIRAGDYFRPVDVTCLPDLVADMLDKGCEHYSKERIARQLELMGSSLDFDAGNFFLTFQSDLVREDLPAYLDMLADILRNPLFPKDELDKSIKQQEASIEASKNDTGQVVANAFYSKVYQPGCVYYQKPFDQQLAELKDVNVELLKQFHDEHITAANTYLAVVGDIAPDAAFKLVSDAFGSWQGKPAEKIDLAKCAVGPVKPTRIETKLPDKTNVEVFMGAPANVDIHAPDFCAASIANAALGHDTISSRLGELRNKYGLTYGISSYFAENAFPNSPWVVDYTVNPENLAKSLPIVDQIISNYRKTGITEAEVKDEANRLAGEYIIERMRTPRQLADALTRYESLGLGVKFMDEYPRRLQAVTREQADAAIAKYFNPGKLVISVAGTLPARP